MLHRFIKASAILLITGILSSCASLHTPIPESISLSPSNDVQLAEVTQDLANYTNAQVRWGGTIISKQAHEDHLRLEVLQRPLDDKGKPITSANSDGRFIAIIPAPYKQQRFFNDRRITVQGIIQGSEQKQINSQTQQTLPIVNVAEHYAWHYNKPYYGYGGYPYTYGFGYGRHGYRHHHYYGHHLHIGLRHRHLRRYRHDANNKPAAPNK